MEIILASASPRRRELLEAAGLKFDVRVPDVDEDALNGLRPDVHALTLAMQKVGAVADKMGEAAALVIAADTVVALEDRILGKPRDAQEARAMLTALRGREHSVITGVAVAQTRPRSVQVNKATTRVLFREFSEKEMEDYVATPEPYDKAGGYGIQGAGGRLIERIDGDYFNVVGLPLGVLFELLSFYMDVRPYSTRLAALDRRFT